MDGSSSPEHTEKTIPSNRDDSTILPGAAEGIIEIRHVFHHDDPDKAQSFNLEMLQKPLEPGPSTSEVSQHKPPINSLISAHVSLDSQPNQAFTLGHQDWQKNKDNEQGSTVRGASQPAKEDNVELPTVLEGRDVVGSVGEHMVETVLIDQGRSDNSAVINDEDLEVISGIPLVNANSEVVDQSEQMTDNEEPPAWVIAAGLTFWTCFIMALIWVVLALAESINWSGVEIFTAVTIPLPSEPWLGFFELPRTFSLTQAKGIDFAASAVCAPIFVALGNMVWFKVARKLSPRRADPNMDLGRDERGSYDIFRITSLMRTSKPQLILFAILLVSSAISATLLSNVLGYKAVSLDAPESKTEFQRTSEELLYQIVYFPILLLPALCAVACASSASLFLVILSRRTSYGNKKQNSQDFERNESVAAGQQAVQLESATFRAQNYVSFPRFHTGRRLFSRGSREIFSSNRRETSGEGEIEPLISHTRPQGDASPALIPWKVPSLRFPNLSLRVKAKNIEECQDIPRGPIEPAQYQDQVREVLPCPPSTWTIPSFGISVWRRPQAPVAPPNRQTIHQLRDRRSSTSIRDVHPKFAAQQSSHSRWKLPILNRFQWPSGSLRPEKKQHQREDASETSSLLSEVENGDVALPHVERTPSFWTIPSSSMRHTATPSRTPSHDQFFPNETIVANHIITPQIKSQPKQYLLPSISSWLSLFKIPLTSINFPALGSETRSLLPSFEEHTTSKFRTARILTTSNTTIGNEYLQFARGEDEMQAETAQTSPERYKALNTGQDNPGSSERRFFPMSKKGKEIERYVDQFESTMPHVPEDMVLAAHATTHERSIAIQPTKPEFKDGDDHDMSASPVHETSWRRWNSHRVAPDDVEGANSIKGSPRTESEWKSSTWWDLTWPHLVDVDQSVSTTNSMQQVSESSSRLFRGPETKRKSPQISTDLGASDGPFPGNSKGPLWTLGRASHSLPRRLLPGCFSTGSSKIGIHAPKLQGDSAAAKQDLSETPSKVWWSSVTQQLLEVGKTPKGKEPASPTEWPCNHDHRFESEDHYGPPFWIGESGGSSGKKMRGSARRQESTASEEDINPGGGDMDTEPTLEIQGYLGL